MAINRLGKYAALFQEMLQIFSHSQAYLTWLRIEKGRELLLTTGKNISEIACACGFSQPAYFSRIFREHAGLSPSRFRMEHQVYQVFPLPGSAIIKASKDM